MKFTRIDAIWRHLMCGGKVKPPNSVIGSKYYELIGGHLFNDKGIKVMATFMDPKEWSIYENSEERKLNLYLISQDENTGYDTYDSAIVAAKSPDEAIKIHPNGMQDQWDHNYPTWASSPTKVSVSKIGETTTEEPGVVLASFNAG